MFNDEFPFSPRRFPIYYGWLIVIAGTLGTIASIPGQTMGVSAFTDHLLAALDLSRTQLSLSYMCGTLCSGILIFQGGRLLDRLGVRRSMVIAASCLGVALSLMAGLGSVVDSVAGLLGGFHTAVAMVVSFAGFFFIRFFGQGLIAMIPRVMIGKWFDKRRGLAFGISGVAVSGGFAVAPLVFNELISLFGWQGAYIALAVAVGVGMTLVAWTFYRERPEDFGLRADGAAQPHGDADSDAGKQAAYRDFTVDEARRSYVFWIFSSGLAMQGLVITAVTFHIVSLSENAGLAAAEGLRLFLPMAVVNVCANFFGGWISDKIRLKYLLFTLAATQMVGGFGVLFMGSFAGQSLMVLGYGVSGGLFGTLIGVAWPRFFGTTHLGAISGLNMSMMVIASSVGPILFGYLFERSGSYAPGIWAAIGLSVPVLVGSIWANNPQQKLAE